MGLGWGSVVEQAKALGSILIMGEKKPQTTMYTTSKAVALRRKEGDEIKEVIK
jgi:hypothetical protein